MGMTMIRRRITILPLIWQVDGFIIWHRDEVKDLDEEELERKAGTQG